MSRSFFTQKFTVLFGTLLVVSIGTLLIAYLYRSEQFPATSAESPEVTIEPVSEIQKAEQKREQQAERERASDALLPAETKKERATLLSKKADYFALNNEFHDALTIYQRVIGLSSDLEYKKKAAAIAFRAREFGKSIEWYTEALSILSTREKEELLLGMRYTKDPDFQKMLSKIDIPAYVRQAYEVSWMCETTFIDCETSIKKYSYNYEPINILKKALEDFKNLQNTDINYKEALLIGAFYKNKDYSTVIRVGANLLSRKPDYKPILKIVGFSAYLTNQYDRAENALKKYKLLDSDDAEVDFLLGLIYFGRNDYQLSNLYFNNAVTGGYQPKNVVERKLAYNYGVLGMNDTMFQVLGHLLENPDVTELDITNALFLALTEKQMPLVQKWIARGMEKFPSSPDILGLRAWSLRLAGNSDTALVILDDILKKTPNHLIALVQAGIIHAEKGETDIARPLLEKAKMIDAGGTWADTLETYLSKDPPKKK
ncbi:MAG: hypothetical protein WC753_03960 [Candidatus Gracilibacteria bacterium]